MICFLSKDFYNTSYTAYTKLKGESTCLNI